MTSPRLTTHIAIFRLCLVWLAVALCLVGLSAPHVQAEALTPAVSSECTATMSATASCMDGHVIMTWCAQSDTVARVTVSFMGLNSGPYDLAAPTFKVDGMLNTDFGSVPATQATFMSQYWSGGDWVTLATQTKSLEAISCNAPTAVHLSSFTATSGMWFTFINHLRHASGIAR
jgi:hypothetical protein